MTVAFAREYKTAKFGSFNPRGIPCGCGRFRSVAAAIVAFGATVFGLPALSAGGSVIL